MSCPGDLLFDPSLNVCNWPEEVSCENSTPYPTTTMPTTSTTTNLPTTKTTPSTTTTAASTTTTPGNKKFPSTQQKVLDNIMSPKA